MIFLRSLIRQPYIRPLPTALHSRLETTASNVQSPRSRRWLYTAISATALTVSAYTVGAIAPPYTLSLLFPRVAPGPPSDATSEEWVQHMANLEQKLQSLPLLRAQRDKSDAAEWYETRPYQNYPEERRVNHLTAGILRGPGKLATLPIMRARRDESECWVFTHLGRSLCGHDGIIHGGLLATLLDEALARIAIVNLPEKVGVTATLSLNYRAPTRADQFVVMKTKLTSVQGRKAFVSGQIEDLQGNVLVEASAIFVQPRYANALNPAAIRQVLGGPPKSSAEGVLLADGESLKPKPRT